MKKYTIAMLLALACAVSVNADTVTRFQAELTEDYVVLGGVQGTGSDAGGFAEFVLTQPDGDPGGTTLSYAIQFENVDLDGLQTPSNIFDDITALHLHDTTQCSRLVPACIDGDTAGTVHVLNIFGLPRLDDDDVMVDAVAGTVTGLWDDGDASPPGTPSPSLPISDDDVLDLLFNGQMAIFVHTQEFPSAAAGGVLTILPEPSAGLVALLGIALWAIRRRG